MIIRVEIWDKKWLAVRISESIDDAVRYYRARRNINPKERIRIIQVLEDSNL